MLFKSLSRRFSRQSKFNTYILDVTYWDGTRYHRVFHLCDDWAAYRVVSRVLPLGVRMKSYLLVRSNDGVVLSSSVY